MSIFSGKGHMITSYDNDYGETLLNTNIKIIKGDIRDKNKLIKSLENQDVVIHLACISNDPVLNFVFRKIN